MTTLEERITQEIMEWESLSRRNKTQIFTSNLEKDVDIRCQNYVGGLVGECLPDLVYRQLHDTEFANSKEFQELACLMSWLAGHRRFVELVLQGESYAELSCELRTCLALKDKAERLKRPRKTRPLITKAHLHVEL